MAQTPERTTVQPAIARSEEIIDRMGQSIGSFAALIRQRIQQTATRVEAGLSPTKIEPTTQREAAKGRQPKQLIDKVAGGLASQGQLPQAELQRAEGIVDDMAQRLALLTSMVGLQIRKMAAYAREGAEDIWVEAHHIRSARGSH
jgi:hypothetical protein